MVACGGVGGARPRLERAGRDEVLRVAAVAERAPANERRQQRNDGRALARTRRHKRPRKRLQLWLEHQMRCLPNFILLLLFLFLLWRLLLLWNLLLLLLEVTSCVSICQAEENGEDGAGAVDKVCAVVGDGPLAERVHERRARRGRAHKGQQFRHNAVDIVVVNIMQCIQCAYNKAECWS